jgi:Lrp/AsnC family transcriptional regulator
VVPDIKSYDDLYQRLISKVEIYDISSMIAMEKIKSTTEIPLNYLK